MGGKLAVARAWRSRSRQAVTKPMKWKLNLLSFTSGQHTSERMRERRMLY